MVSEYKDKLLKKIIYFNPSLSEIIVGTLFFAILLFSVVITIFFDFLLIIASIFDLISNPLAEKDIIKTSYLILGLIFVVIGVFLVLNSSISSFRNKKNFKEIKQENMEEYIDYFCYNKKGTKQIQSFLKLINQKNKMNMETTPDKILYIALGILIFEILFMKYKDILNPNYEVQIITTTLIFILAIVKLTRMHNNNEYNLFLMNARLLFFDFYEKKFDSLLEKGEDILQSNMVKKEKLKDFLNESETCRNFSFFDSKKKNGIFLILRAVIWDKEKSRLLHNSLENIVIHFQSDLSEENLLTISDFQKKIRKELPLLNDPVKSLNLKKGFKKILKQIITTIIITIIGFYVKNWLTW